MCELSLYCLTSAKTPRWPSHDQQGARSFPSILNCSEASLRYRLLLTSSLRYFFLGPIQFLQADHLVLSIKSKVIYLCSKAISSMLFFISALIPTALEPKLSGTTASLRFKRTIEICLCSRISFSNGKRMMVGVLNPTPSSIRQIFLPELIASDRKSPNSWTSESKDYEL